MTPTKKSAPQNIYSIDIESESLFICLEGEVTLKVTPDLKQEMMKSLERSAQNGVKEVVIDLSGTTFMDSTGISTLVVLRKRSKELGIDMRLIKPSQQVRKILALVQLTEYFQIED